MAEIYKIGSDDIIDKVSTFGGTNLLTYASTHPHVQDAWSAWYTPAANIANSCLGGFSGLYFPTDTAVGDIFIFSYEFEWTKFTAGTGGTFSPPKLQWYANGSWSSGITSPWGGTLAPASATEIVAAAGLKKQVQKVTITAENQITANWYANWRTDYSDGTGTFRIRRFQLERSNGVAKSTDWTPAPEDLVTISGEQLVLF